MGLLRNSDYRGHPHVAVNTTITIIDKVGRFLEKALQPWTACYEWYMAYAHDHVWAAEGPLQDSLRRFVFTAVHSYRFVKYVYTNRREIAARMNEIREQVSVAFTYRITYQ